MAFRELFTEDEWARLLSAPFWVIGAVGLADGTVEEAEHAAGIKALYHSPLLKGALAREVLMAAYSDLDTVFEYYKGDHRPIAEVMQDVAAVVTAKAPADEAVLYKAALMELGIKVARASGDDEEGPVTMDEGATLGWIESWLGISSDEASLIAAGYGVADEEEGPEPSTGFYL